MPFCHISLAFLFLGFSPHLKLLIHFRVTCCISNTEKSGPLSKEQDGERASNKTITGSHLLKVGEESGESLEQCKEEGSKRMLLEEEEEEEEGEKKEEEEEEKKIFGYV